MAIPNPNPPPTAHRCHTPPPEPAPALAPAPAEVSACQPVEQLICTAHALKVSLHCEGCKRKVKKILRSIEGVYTVKIDLKQQKVDVTGNIDRGTLINKLIKSGKHAEPWPDAAPTEKKKKKRKSKKKKKPANPNNPNPPTEHESDSSDPDSPEKEGPVVKFEVPPDQQKSGHVSFMPPQTGEFGGGKPGLAQKVEGRKPEAGTALNYCPAEDGGFDGSPCSCQMKKKRGHYGPGEGGPWSIGAHACPECGTFYSVAPPGHLSPPRHHGYQYPPHYYSPPPAAYAVSYKMAHPAGGYTASYYSAPPPYAHAYTYPSMEAGSPLSDSESYLRQSSCSLELFSDENPNGCSIM
ncbi:hypothetical protein NMG60_11020789 [Bertholletia excelsa]